MVDENIPVAKPVDVPVQTQPPAPSASGRAIAALILGILSLLCMGFLSGIPAIILGSMELKAIKAGHAPQAGEGVARVGYILGIVGTVLTCLAILAFAALMALGMSLGTMGAFDHVTSSV
ncbi:MAG: DUF4190 domain-containing protein [Pseudomonadota bacterium]